LEIKTRYSIWKGATPHKGGCHFTVWAPHAEDVFVIGTFNDWDKTTHRMNRNSNGLWSIDVSGVKVGDEYQYRIINANKGISESERQVNTEQAKIAVNLTILS